MVSTYNACSSPYSSSSFSSEEAYTAASIQAFGENLHGTLKNNCAQCHGAFQSPLFAVDDPVEAHDTVIGRSLVDLKRPGASYFLTQLQGGHQGFGQDVIDQVASGIQAWAEIMEDYETLNPSPDPDSVVEFQVASDDSVLSKVKFLVHGGAVTASEYQAFMSSSNQDETLKDLVDVWMQTEEGVGKLKLFFKNALNQDFLTNGELFDDTVNELNASMRESFSRTALDIVERDRPFTEIATTSRYAVNTALLVGYAWMDRRSNPEDRNLRIRNFLRSTDDDNPEIYSDWRFINFEQDDNEQVSYLDFNYYQDLNNNDTVRFSIPRVGYFSTLAFQANYPTNVDNQYRVTINQTLIAGLGTTFSPSDNTTQPHMIHMDVEHAPEDSDCFACHRTMDPMRNIFRNKMNDNYRFSSEFSGELSSFALYGYTNEMTELSDLGESIANHPDFHKAWAQKLCVAFNTTKCLESDSEFQSLANLFRSSNYNFKTLYKEMVTSSLVTASSNTQTSLTNGFYVNRMRRSHFCQSVNARFRQIQADRGVEMQDYDQGRAFCSNARIRDAANSLGDDHTVRGLTEVVNSFETDTFARQTIDRICWSTGDFLMRTNAVLNRNENALDETLDLVTKYIIGLPESHPRHNIVRQAVDIVYSYARETEEMNHMDSIRQVVAFGCSTPDFIGAGL